MSPWLILVPLLSTLLGWGMIRLSVSAIFRPINPIRVLGMRIQGLIPGNLDRLSVEAGKFAAGRFSLSSIQEKIGDPGSFDSIKPLVETHVDHFLRHKLPEQMPMIGMFIGDKTISTLKEIFIREVEELFPQVMQQFAGNLEQGLDLESIVSKQVSSMSIVELEQKFRSRMKKEIRKAETTGLIIGLLIGILQLIIVFCVT